MPIATESKVLGLDDLKIASVTTDSASSLAYGSLVDIPGAIELAVKPNIDSRVLEGDNQVLDMWGRVKSIDWSFKNAKLPLDALAIILGGAVVAAGVTPDQKQTLTLLNTDNTKFFKLEGQSKYTDVGDAHVVLYKCKAENVDYTIQGDFANVSASGKAIPTINNGKIKEVILNETAAAIA